MFLNKKDYLKAYGFSEEYADEVFSLDKEDAAAKVVSFLPYELALAVWNKFELSPKLKPVRKTPKVGIAPQVDVEFEYRSRMGMKATHKSKPVAKKDKPKLKVKETGKEVDAPTKSEPVTPSEPVNAFYKRLKKY